MIKSSKAVCAVASLAAMVHITCAQLPYGTPSDDRWVTMSDEAFATEFAGMAFDSNLEDRELVAGMIFARVNQLVVDDRGGMSGTGKVPVWMTWPTDPDTFHSTEPFPFEEKPRADMRPTAEKKDLESGPVATADPDGANEEVTRNKISYDYLVDRGLTTKTGVAAYFNSHAAVDMPLGSIELKASWLQVTEGSPAPPGALSFEFEGGEYWWRGLHLMVKMRLLEDPTEAFYSDDATWFWATFEFNDNPGVAQVRDHLITQRDPLSAGKIASVLESAGLTGFGLDAYAPNGTQVGFTEEGTGDAVILGHTDMEDFAGRPNTAQPQYWTQFNSSCHTCHATASYNPATKAFFPFSVPAGALDPSYNATDSAKTVQYLGQGYRPLDFMWPIVFQAR